MPKIITCMKSVPDVSTRLVIRDDKKWIRDQDLTFGPGEADEYALEAALKLVEDQGGEVVVLTLGDENAGRTIRTGLAKGAARAIHLVDPAFEGGDEYVTSLALARAVAKDGGADLVLTGVQSDDVGGGVTGIMLAEHLGWAHASVVIGLEPAQAEAVRVRRELEGGRVAVLDVDLPCVLTIQYGINEPRYASLKGIMAAKKKEVRRWTAADLGLGPEETGSAGALSQVHEIVLPSRPGEVRMIPGSAAESAATLVELLRREAKVI
jgi:electron transfer flavoprotein beta subunit